LARFRLSHRAEDDFLNILNYTIRKWGTAQAERYLDRIEACFEMLAENPMLGRQCEGIAPGLRRIEEGKHTIFYRPDTNDLKIERVLHHSMLPSRQMMEGDQ